MAAIQSIRKRTGLLVVVVGLAMAGFLMMDAFQNNSNIFTGDRNIIGSVNGVQIEYPAFDKEYISAEQVYRINNPSANVDEMVTTTIRQQVWDQITKNMIMSTEYESLGIMVTGEEMYDMIFGDNPDATVKQAFTNPNTNTFDRLALENYIKDLDLEENADKRQIWKSFEASMREDKMRSKYMALAKKATYVPAFQARMAYKEQSVSSSASFVSVSYNTVTAEEITPPTDAELNDYLKKNKSRYKQDASRSIKYVSFNIIPSGDDTSDVLRWMNEQLEPFKNTDDDSSFVMGNSDYGYDNGYLKLDQLVSSIKDSIFNADTGTMIGPYYDEGDFVIAKINSKKAIPDSVKASQILIKADANDQASYVSANKIVDSLQTLIDADATIFGDLAREFSEESESAFRGGSMGWVKPNQQFREFNHKLFYKHDKGDIFKVFSNLGVHLVIIEESPKNEMAVQVAMLKRRITSSSRTNDDIYSLANTFAGTYRTVDEFEAAVENDPLLTIREATNIKLSEFEIRSLGNARDMIKWAYDAELNQVSKVFELKNEFVVAYLSDVNEEGTQELEDVRIELEQEVVKLKKFEVIKSKINSAGGSAAGLDALASALGSKVQTATGITFENPNLAGVGLEPEVVATALGLEINEVSDPVKGVQGVYVIQLTSQDEIPATADLANAAGRVRDIYKQQQDFRILNAVERRATIEDNRHNFF